MNSPGSTKRLTVLQHGSAAPSISKAMVDIFDIEPRHRRPNKRGAAMAAATIDDALLQKSR